jgi:hypothetical protein
MDKKIKELIDNTDLSFKRFERWGGFHFTSCRYFDIMLLPAFNFFIDSQMNETFDWGDNEGIHESYIGIGLHFDWLGFNAGFQINFKTNKPLSDETTT